LCDPPMTLPRRERVAASSRRAACRRHHGVDKWPFDRSQSMSR
jgi:hypothetical protein